MDWYLEVKIWVEDKQCSSYLLIQEMKVTETQNILTSLYHVSRDTCTVHGRGIKTRYFGSVLILRSKKDLTFYQTRSNAIVLQGTLPACCIPKVERLKIGEVFYERQYLSPRPPPKISLKHDLNWNKGNASWKNHDRTGQPDREERLHKVQEVGYLKNRDDADKFNLAMDDENIDFNISGVPNAMVKRSQSISVHNLIQKIESHPQREAIQKDLQQHRAFNTFSKESKDAIMAAGNTELCEIINVEPKLQCKACFTHWSAWIVFCTCGHLMKDDSAKNKKYISSVLDLFSIPTFYIRKDRPHGHRYGKAPGCKEYHTADQLQKKRRKKKYDSIHYRFIRDKTFRKTMIELGRSEKIIFEMDQLASENHTHIATRAEIDVYRGNLWIRSNVVNFDTMPTRHQLDFKKALSTLYRLKKAEDEKQYAKWSQSSSSWWQWQTNWWESDYENSPQRWGDHWLNGPTCVFSGQLFICGMNLSKNWIQNFIVNISVTADGSLLSPTECVNTIHPEPETHEQINMTNGYGKSVQDYKHILNIGERIVNNNVNDATHVDLHTLQHWAHCMRSVVESSESIHISHWLKPFALVFHSHPIHGHAHCCLSVSLPSRPLLPALLFFFLFFMVDNGSMIMNTLCNSANGTFVTLDDYFPDALAPWTSMERFFVGLELLESCERIARCGCGTMRSALVWIGGALAFEGWWLGRTSIDEANWLDDIHEWLCAWVEWGAKFGPKVRVGNESSNKFDHAHDRTLPSQIGWGHLEVFFRFICVEKMVFIFMLWKLELDHMLTMMFKLLASMRLEYHHRSAMTNTLAWNSILLEQPQHDNPILSLRGAWKHSTLDQGQERMSEWDGSLSGCGGLTVTRRDEQLPELRSRLVVQETRQTSTISVSDVAAVTSSMPPLEVVRLFCSLMVSMKGTGGGLLFKSSWT